MTLLINIATAFAVFIVSVVILSTNYKTVWPAPNFVTHSATYDFIFQDIATNSFLTNPISIEYAYKSLPIATSSCKLINSTTGDSAHHSELVLHQSILEKQANLHHLLHIPPWALVPDRISSTSGSVTDLFKIFDSLRNKQEHTLSILSDIIEIIPTESIMKSHMEQLTAGQKFWLSNMTRELFNASQTIFSYQLINYAEEITEWIQNSPYSNQYLRLIFERTCGWPLLYNPSIHSMHEIHSYQALCQQIMELMDDDDEDILTMAQCELFLDSMLPWIPDKPATLTTMWPTYYDVDVEALKKIKGINSPYTMVIKQNRKPSGEVLHYVSATGQERIQVEWFNEKKHLRATNLAFVRRIRIQIKRIANILKNSVTLSGEIDEEDDLASWWASLEAETEQGPKPSDRHIEQLSVEFKQYIKNYASELEKGQFEKILNMDLAQNEHENKIFIHGLPSIAVFNDGGIKRAWNFIIGVIDYDLFQSQTGKETQNSNEFIDFMDVNRFQSSYHKKAHKIELEMIGVWPYAVAGYLRGITPEVFSYTYPPFNDAKKVYGKQRCVLLLDVMEKLYSNNMREIGIKRLIHSNDAKLITLASMIKYVTNLLRIKHQYFHNRDDRNKIYSEKQAFFIRLAAIIQCGDDYGCVLSGVFYNIIEAFNRENEFSLVFIAFLEKERLIQWSKKEINGNTKDVINVLDSGGNIAKLRDNDVWNEWKNKYFDGEDDINIYKLKNEFVDNTEMMKIYKRTIRHVSKYAVVRRPGEDTFALLD